MDERDRLVPRMPEGGGVPRSPSEEIHTERQGEWERQTERVCGRDPVPDGSRESARESETMEGTAKILHVSRGVLKDAQGGPKSPMWTVIHGNVYDIGAWVDRHPGGDVIRVAAGRDATWLFQSYHGKHVEAILDQFYVGKLVDETHGTGVEHGEGEAKEEKRTITSLETRRKQEEGTHVEEPAEDAPKEGTAPPERNAKLTHANYRGPANLDGMKQTNERRSSPTPIEHEVLGNAEQDLEPVAQYQSGPFYDELKRRVAKEMRQNGLNPRKSTSMYVKTALILISCVTTWWSAFFSPFRALRMLCAALLGFCRAQVGVSIQHDANHGAYSRNKLASTIAGASLDFVGASSFMWKQQHVVGHHAYTNVDGMDPDIRVGEKDVRRVTKHQPWYPYHAFQHLYLGWLYSLLAIKSFAIDDFLALKTGRIGNVHINKMTLAERQIFWAGKSFYFFCVYMLPWRMSTAGWTELLLLWALNEAFAGWTLAFLFQVAHVVGEVDFIKANEKTGKVDREWAIAQLETTADFSHGSSFWLHVSGGLNHQVVHHLFPGICHTHYPRIAPIVKQLCEEKGVKYRVFPSFWTALQAHFRYMKHVGSVKVPSLATIG